MKLNTNNLCVLLIDMQEEYITTDRKRSLIPNQIKILDVCKEKNIPLAVIEFKNEGETDPVLKNKIEEIPVCNVCTFIKSEEDAFSEIYLDTWLKKMNAKTLLIMGIHSCSCLYETAASAVNLGYNIITCGDLMSPSDYYSQFPDNDDWYIQNGVYAESSSELLFN